MLLCAVVHVHVHVNENSNWTTFAGSWACVVQIAIGQVLYINVAALGNEKIKMWFLTWINPFVTSSLAIPSLSTSSCFIHVASRYVKVYTL